MFTPTISYGITADPKSSGPLGYRHALAVPVDHIGRRSILVLREMVRPSAITERISLAIIDAVYRVFGWCGSHISIELAKVFPCIADANSDASISGEQTALGVFTPSFQLGPDLVFPAFVKTMLSIVGPARFSAKASTRSHSTRFQRARSNDSVIATFTSTFPPSYRVSFNNATNHGESREYLAGKINGWSTHRGISYTI